MDKIDAKASEIFSKAQKNPYYYIELCLSIFNKRGRYVPFKLNPAQRQYASINSRFKIILKARKLGFSTLIIARAIWRCAFLPGRRAVIVSHTKDAAQRLLLDRAIPIIKSSIIPLAVEDRKDWIEFKDTGSRLWIGASGSKRFGRGDDITDYHLSEYAHYEDVSVGTGIEEAITEDAYGDIESTANGTNHLHELWVRSLAKQSRYTPLFVPWWANPEYCVKDARLDVLGEEEHRLISTFGLSHGQIAWRRSKITEMSNPQLFSQEYPAYPEEAFLSSGRMVFDWQAIIKHEQYCSEPKLIGYLEEHGGFSNVSPDSKGNLAIWDMPVNGHVYCIGADVAEGVDGGAYSAAIVIDLSTKAQAAEGQGHIEPDRFADVLARLGSYYNHALLAPEVNNMGLVTVNRLRDLGYNNLYQRKVSQNRSDDQLYGFQTTANTKNLIIGSFAGEAIRDFGFSIRSAALLSEIRTYVYNASNKMVAQSGCYSDRIMAAAICWHISKEIGDIPVTPRFRDSFKSSHGITISSSPSYGVREE